MASLEFPENFPDSYFEEDLLWQALWGGSTCIKSVFLVMIVEWESLSYDFSKICVWFCLLLY